MTPVMAARLSLAGLIDLVGGRVACLAMSKDQNAKVTVLLFPGGQDQPGYVAKVPTTGTAARRVERDVKAVHRDVHALLDAGILRKTREGRIVFPFEAVRVSFVLQAA